MRGRDADIRGIIDSLGLAPHPEGGYFREIFRDTEKIPGNRAGTIRNVSTSILFLIPGGGHSCFHRLNSNEDWNFNLGSPIEVIELVNNSLPRKTLVGPENLRHTIKAGTWFGARLAPEMSFGLVTCTVSPGFDFADFEMANQGGLLAEYPESGEIIRLLT